MFPPINVSYYTAIKEHLDYYFSHLEKRQDQGVTPYNLRNCAYHEEFERDKIIYAEIAQRPAFYIDESVRYYPEATTFLLTGKHLKLLVAVMNSQAFTYFFSHYYAGGGLGESGYRYKKAFLENTPVPVINSANLNLVNQIERRAMSMIAGASSLNNRYENNLIDKYVNELYELTDREATLIRNTHPR